MELPPLPYPPYTSKKEGKFSFLHLFTSFSNKNGENMKEKDNSLIFSPQFSLKI